MKSTNFTDNAMAGVCPHTKGFGVGVYIHIPFCRKKCNYCDFVSVATNKKHACPDFTSGDYADKYLNVLSKEFASCSSLLSSLSPLTLYIGGGTPSILSEKQIEFLFKELFLYFRLDSIREATFEINPESITEGKLKLLKEYRVNRLSIGLQSFDNNILKLLGRVHEVGDFLRCYELARKTGFDNINVDLIFGIPGQPLKIWKDTLAETIRLHPEHISTYSLTIEEGTSFFNQDLRKDTDLDADMYEFAIEFLKEKGYCHYEISNFSRPGLECKHNINYWRNGGYFGFGLGAVSYIKGKRIKNTEKFDEYLAGKFHAETEENDNKIKQSEDLILGLRMIKGIEINDDIKKRFYSQICALKNQGLLNEQDNSLKLTDRGILFANQVFREFV
ncbi:MAG: radical SAM family heme chaperone HemW [Elusimicrobia bacterium]|nr:radical SAM family heme chaperone HemW [Elusimicrobiota bacterium]